MDSDRKSRTSVENYTCRCRVSPCWRGTTTRTGREAIRANVILGLLAADREPSAARHCQQRIQERSSTDMAVAPHLSPQGIMLRRCQQGLESLRKGCQQSLESLWIGCQCKKRGRDSVTFTDVTWKYNKRAKTEGGEGRTVSQSNSLTRRHKTSDAAVVNGDSSISTGTWWSGYQHLTGEVDEGIHRKGSAKPSLSPSAGLLESHGECSFHLDDKGDLVLHHGRSSLSHRHTKEGLVNSSVMSESCFSEEEEDPVFDKDGLFSPPTRSRLDMTAKDEQSSLENLRDKTELDWAISQLYRFSQ